MSFYRERLYPMITGSYFHHQRADVGLLINVCRAVLVDGPSFPLLFVARTDLGMPMDAILVTIQGSERWTKEVAVACD